MDAVTIRRTDCGTGYLVLVAGRVVESCRSYAAAQAMAEFWRGKVTR